MSQSNGDPQHAGSNAATLHQATRVADGSGAVIKGMEVDIAAAISQRKLENDVVVCGDDAQTNRELALRIEEAVGPWMRQQKHTRSAGQMALPHFQQRNPPPYGHTFYETAKAKARKGK